MTSTQILLQLCKNNVISRKVLVILKTISSCEHNSMWTLGSSRVTVNQQTETAVKQNTISPTNFLNSQQGSYRHQNIRLHPRCRHTARTWRNITNKIYRDVHYAFSKQLDAYAPLCEDTMSFWNLWLHTVLQCHPRMTKLWPWVTCTENFMKFGCVFFEIWH